MKVHWRIKVQRLGFDLISKKSTFLFNLQFCGFLNKNSNYPLKDNKKKSIIRYGFLSKVLYFQFLMFLLPFNVQFVDYLSPHSKLFNVRPPVASNFRHSTFQSFTFEDLLFDIMTLNRYRAWSGWASKYEKYAELNVVQHVRQSCNIFFPFFSVATLLSAVIPHAFDPKSPTS